MLTDKRINTALFFLMGISAIIRAILASNLDLGNDEVYYWTYALYPDWSHFDHPPMVGFTIQLFSFNLLFDSEFFIRLGAIVFGTLNTLIIFRIGQKIKDSLAGLYAAILYNTSIYSFIIAGTFILPDSPQLFFWLLAILFALKALSSGEVQIENKKDLLLAGLFIGLGMLSKYTTVFIWFGIGGYILFNNRKWLKSFSLYASVFISLMLFFPVIWWNMQNDFISLAFQGGRVSLLDSSLRPDFLLTEILGEFFYNNPVNVVLAIMAIWAFVKKKDGFMGKKPFHLIMWTSIPLILVFILFSLFRRTLPHWTGPAYVTLNIVAASWLSSVSEKREYPFMILGQLRYAIYLILLIVVAGLFQVNCGFINPDAKNTAEKELGKKDISLDLYGWEQISEGFTKIFEKDLIARRMGENAVIISNRWFPAANLDYYVARPLGLNLLAIGDLGQIHKYHWINKDRGGFSLGMEAYYITTSRDFTDPNTLYKNYFESIEAAGEFPISRCGKHVMNVFVYRMQGMKRIPDSRLE
ncbi:MAG: glycosyltransferase family 39 protein [Chlorobi bacterium]|nr:glycosyltransferase family 39 protein [Chlorobiota bacterium]